MLRQIRALKATTDFDFRRFASPHDPLRHLFPEWVDYYRGKYAICRAVNPKSILEVGVRFGYSALAFLNAVPHARYTGIDNDSDTFGGSHGALQWAREQLANYSAQIVVADSQKLATLPGEYYDLVHIDGQQDGDGTFHDLELGLEKAHWLLVDGYFWSRENMLSATYFMEKYKSLIAGAYVIPGYAGDLLIETETRENHRPFRRTSCHHDDLRGAYDAAYFLSDCGGHALFKAHLGRRLWDLRLLTLFDIAAPAPGMRVLDVGCGRGELAYACFEAGATVVGLDYSESAIEIARSTFADCLGDALTFVHQDVLEYAPEGKFDLVFAADVVEHLSGEALDAALRLCASWLAPGGKLVAHTWPNRIAYERNHRLRRIHADQAGTYLPKNPRTYYEDMVHINEQTPARFRRALRRAFPHVAISVSGGSTDGCRSLRARIRSAESIFAVASAAPIESGYLETHSRQLELDPDIANCIIVESVELPSHIRAGTRFEGSATLVNRSSQALASLPPFPVHLSYHWHQHGAVAQHDGLRTPLLPRLHGHARRSYVLSVQAPPIPGHYELVVTLVQESRFWFDKDAGGALLIKTVHVE
jgi:2-polyprenyl-3-methyl-5-hydroxy-6-metoxy-1,4-benzoquinol methylase